MGRRGAIDERVVEDQLCALVGDLGLPPQLHLALQRFEVSLNAVNADREHVDQVEALSVHGQDRGERTCDNATKSSDALTSCHARRGRCLRLGR